MSLDELRTEMRKLRRRRGWSQQLLADFTGLNLQTVYRFEQGKRITDTAVIVRMLDTLGYELDIKPKAAQ
jgi:transcriptional regulator with XRE-family HTH domain